MIKEVLKNTSALILNQSQGCLFGMELKKKEPTSWEGVKTQRRSRPLEKVFIDRIKETPPILCHACQLGKHVRLPFVSSDTVVTSCFDRIHSDVGTSPIPNDTLSRYKARLVENGSTQLEGVDPIHQLDVKNAFLHGDLFETVYMHLPPGFGDSTYPDHVCLLQRSLYGLKHEMDTAYLLLYVDDIVLMASSQHLLQRIIASLHQEFSMTDLGSHNYFLGSFVTRDSSGMFLSQSKYVFKILEKEHMLNCNSSRTLVDTESKLGADGDPISDPTLYQSLAGFLQYLTFTQSDISYAIQQVCLYIHDPQEPHFSALKRILRYVHGFPTTRRSTSGYCVFLGNNLLSWFAKSQPTLSRSSAEAEYHSVANAADETCWLRNLLRELHTPLSSVTLVYCDNVSAIYLSCNSVQHQRTKHIEIDIHFVCDLVVAG
ncbi:ribonuclease H-like domain-containing protein [Tanacetum coccineum]